MTISGQFRDKNNNLITVTISSSKSGEDMVIGENGLLFGGEPLQIEWKIDDSFETIIRKSCTINLVTDSYIGAKLFAYNSREVSVTVTRGNSTLFSGFVDPNTFNQPYVNRYDEFQINCIDYLSTLQYYNYKNTTIRDYASKKETADNVTLLSIINQMLPSGSTVFYDQSKGIESGRTKYLFNDISVSELIFYGDDEDDLKTQEETLTYILTYLNLHIIQNGNNFYIFDWDKLRNSSIKQFVNINNTNSYTILGSGRTVTNFADSDTSISIADVYNQVSLTCDLKEQETLIESPLESDKLTSLYSGKQLYLTEYISEGSGDNANNAFNAMVDGNTTTYEGAKTIDWFMQVMKNPNWKLNINASQTIDNICETDNNGTYINQYKIPLYLKNNSLTPAILRMGSVETQGNNLDNSPISKVDMKDYLFISINGNESDTESGHLPADSTLQSKAPVIEYTNNNSGGIYSPADDETTNYLVFSGKLLLQPIAYESSTSTANRNNNYNAIESGTAPKSEGATAAVPKYNNSASVPIIPTGNNLVTSDNNPEGRYYTRKFYNTVNVNDDATTNLNAASLQPFTKDKSAHGYKYQYSAVGDGTDQMSKLPVLECELIIGDKRLVETDMDMYGNSTFQWVTVGNEPTQTIDGVTYTITTFSLGVNPKINDFIIGDEFKIQNTIKYQMNLDAEGTAIPIKKNDNLNGKVTFRILGTVNTLWNDITRRHPSFWRHTTWSSASRFILAHTENIIIEDFECKIYSDNGLNTSNGSDELVYMSAESNDYINKKDDIDFNIITQLTSSECLEKGLTSSVNLNAAILTNSKTALRSIYNNGETAKPEEHYINSYYAEYNQPKIILECTLHQNPSFADIYTWNSLNKTFFINGISEDIKFNRTKLTLKEI